MKLPNPVPAGAVLAAALLTSLSPIGGGGSVAPAAATAVDPFPADSAQVVLDWERTAFATVYPAKPIPVGVPILGFTSMAMYDAATTSLQRGRSSETAAVAAAAHDVLAHYIPAAGTTLGTKLATSLATVQDAAARAKGARIGHAAAAEMLAGREGDGWEDPDIHYSKPAVPGFWQPATVGGDMLAAWLGSLDPLVLDSPVPVDGHDAMTSADYTADFIEVRDYGRAGTESLRSEFQTDTAYFFAANAATMIGDAMIRRLEANPTDLRTTALFFARMHASMTDSVIRCWELKRDVGFWRPFQAIAGAGSDGNPDTPAPVPGEPAWTSLLTTPPYSDYVSGHGCLTSPAAETIRMMFGENTTLELRWSIPGSTQVPSPTVRTYTNLTTLESDAFHSRIWGGLHFRDAMVDAYAIGHATAHRVFEQVQ